jgi:two-component system cell cycle sensor histidine kinase/response regulator CckA
MSVISKAPRFTQSGLLMHRYVPSSLPLSSEENRWLEHRLSLAERQLAELQHVAQIGFWEWDVAQDKITWSDQLCEIFGCRPEDFAGSYHGYLALYHPDDRDRGRATIEATFRTGQPFEFEHRILRANGEVRHIHGKGRAIRNSENQTVRMIGTAQDITQRKETETALQQAHAELEWLMAAVPDYLWCADVTEGGQIAYRYYSPVVERITGRPASFYLPGPDQWMSTVHPEDQRELQTKVEGLVQRGPGEASAEYRVVLPNGDVRWVHDRVFAHARPEGGLRLVGIVSDVTERRVLEERLRQSQKTAAIGQLAGGIAHHFNNLLTVINGYAEMLVASETYRAAAEPGQRILAAGKRAAELTSQLLAFGRKQILQPVPLDVNHFLQETFAALTPLLPENIKVTLFTEPSLPPIKVDPSLFQNALVNLALNARDAMAGGGTLTIRTGIRLQAPELTQNDVRTGDFVRILVQDTGTGMSQYVKSRLFEPFFTTKGFGKGVGLGLATVHGFVRQSGGSILVESSPNEGSSFELLLPAFVVTEKSQDKTVLLAEDEPMLLEWAGKTMEEAGYRVIRVEDGTMAIAQLERDADSIDIVVADLVMPNAGGVDVAQWIAEHGWNIPVVFMTGHETHAPKPPFPHVSLLRKPFSAEALVRAIRAAIGAVR